MEGISISPGNTKMGAIPSVSLPSVTTCISCGCNDECYSKKLEKLRPNVAAAYQRNLDLLLVDPDTYWRSVEAAIMTTKYFRFHVGGDIPNAEYFLRMVAIAERQPHCEILCFTKKYNIVNSFLGNGGSLPKNLHIIFSAWVGLEMSNPFSLPTAHVKYADGNTTASASAQECHGNCTECAITDSGCWTLNPGEEVFFKKH